VKKYLHVGIHWVGAPRTDEIQRLIEAPNAAEDWFKYGGNCWVVYSQYDQKAWAEYLSPHVGESSLIILEVTNMQQTNGRLIPSLWEWFNKLRY
jgi:hypothetical protein